MRRKPRKITENGHSRIDDAEFQPLREALAELQPQTEGQAKLLQSVEKLCEAFAYDVDAQGRTWLPITASSQNFNAIENLEALRNQSRYLYTFNGLARGIIDLVADYCCGRCPKVAITHDSPAAQERLRNAWEEDAKSDDVHFNGGGYEGVVRALRDGDAFHRMVILPEITIGKTTLPERVGWRFMDPEHVKEPDDHRAIPPEEDWSHGVITLKHDAMTVLGYWYMGERIPADEVIHIKVGVDSNSKRGLPFLLPAAPDILDYGKFRKSRTLMNIMRSALAIIAEMKEATPGAIARKANSLRAQTTSPNSVFASNPNTAQRTNWQPGTTLIAGPGTEYKMLDAKIGADDAKEDGRGILLMIAAATNLPEYMVSRDCSNAALASLQVSEAPGIVSLLSWQDEFMKIEAKRVRMTLAYRDDLDDYLKDAKIEVIGPPIAIVDEEKQTKALAVEKQNSIVSRQTWQAKRGYDPETEDTNIADDRTSEIVPLPPADPTGLAKEIRKNASQQPA